MKYKLFHTSAGPAILLSDIKRMVLDMRPPGEEYESTTHYFTRGRRTACDDIIKRVTNLERKVKSKREAPSESPS